MSETTIYTDGACSGNPGPGGWGAVILTPDGRVRELGGGEPRTTNNRMELRAAIEALAVVQDQEGPIGLYTDSTYVITGITKWAMRWKRNGWLRADGGEVLNRDLWESLQAALSIRGASGGVQWRYVRGHSGTAGNERADAIAVSFAQGGASKLYDGLLIGYPLDLVTTQPPPNGNFYPP